MTDAIHPRFHLLSADEKMVRYVPDARRRIFEGIELVCVAADDERAAQILAALNGGATGEIGKFDQRRMAAAAKAFDSAGKKKLRAAIVAYLAALPEPSRNDEFEVAF